MDAPHRRARIATAAANGQKRPQMTISSGRRSSAFVSVIGGIAAAPALRSARYDPKRTSAGRQLPLDATKIGDDRENALPNRRFGITSQVCKRFKCRILIVFMRHWQREIALMPRQSPSYEWGALMAAPPNRHLVAKVSSAAWLSSINYLKDCASVEYVIIFLCKNG